MPGRKFNTPGYRYGFNGKEKEDEIANVEGAYDDFGARMYDSRLGRWFSRDIAEFAFSSVSPYVFVNDNPIRYLDINGMYPGDCNLMIIIGQYDKPQLPTTEGDWTVIRANSMEEVLLYMQVANIKKGEVDNLAIETHGYSQTGNRGGFLSSTGSIVYTDLLKNDKSKTKNSSIPKENINNLDAFGKVLDYLEDNSSILIGACGGGREDEFNLLLFDYIKSHVKSFDLLLSSSNVSYDGIPDPKQTSLPKSERDPILFPTFDANLIEDKNLSYGGFQRYSTDGIDENNYNVIIEKNNSIFSGEFELSKIPKNVAPRKAKTIPEKSLGKPMFK